MLKETDILRHIILTSSFVAGVFVILSLKVEANTLKAEQILAGKRVLWFHYRDKTCGCLGSTEKGFYNVEQLPRKKPFAFAIANHGYMECDCQVKYNDDRFVQQCVTDIKEIR